MLKRVLLVGLIGVTALSGCQKVIIEPMLPSVKEALQQRGLMGQALSNDTEMLKTIEQHESEVVTLTDEALIMAASPMTVTAFLDSSAGKVFLRHHILIRPVTASGTYISLSGATWNTTGGAALTTLNGVSIDQCIYVRGAVPKLSRACVAYQPIPFNTN